MHDNYNIIIMKIYNHDEYISGGGHLYKVIKLHY